MTKGIIGRKLGMTQIFTENGRVIPVTVIEAGPCRVVQKKTIESDGYNALQLGLGSVSPVKVTKPLKGHFERAGVEARRYLREFRVKNAEEYEVGDEVKADIFAPGEKVDVSAVSRGKGFAGVIKRWGMSGGHMSHGSKYHRGPGSLASPWSSSGVFPGRRLPGRMGGKMVTVKNLEVVRVDSERNVLLVKGAVPGYKGALVTIKSAVR